MEIPPQYCAPFHESSNKPHLMLGCEPTALAGAFVACILIGYSAPTFWGVGGAFLLFFFLREVLREMAKDDPYMLSVHAESQRYNQGFWTAKPVKSQRWRSQ